VNSLALAVLSFAVGVSVRPIGTKPELQHGANYASIQALAPGYISIDIFAWWYHCLREFPRICYVPGSFE
jgi:hypothetical protein